MPIRPPMLPTPEQPITPPARQTQSPSAPRNGARDSAHLDALRTSRRLGWAGPRRRSAPPPAAPRRDRRHHRRDRAPRVRDVRIRTTRPRPARRARVRDAAPRHGRRSGLGVRGAQAPRRLNTKLTGLIMKCTEIYPGRPEAYMYTIVQYLGRPYYLACFT